MTDTALRDPARPAVLASKLSMSLVFVAAGV